MILIFAVVTTCRAILALNFVIIEGVSILGSQWK
jgi:hypothetical protein